VRLPAFLPPSVLASLAVHGAAVVFALASIEAPRPAEPRLLAVAPGVFATPLDPESPPEPAAPPSELPPLDLDPVLVEVEPDFPALPASGEPDPSAPSLHLGIDVPTAGARIRRPGAVPVPAVPAAPPAPRNAVPSASVTSRPAPSASNRPPPYPLEARRLGWDGVAVFQVVVRADGTVADVALERSTGFAVLDQAAEEAVRSWTFSPARRDGIPAEAIVRLPVVFRLS
jgi:periplasmic protein TonB